MKTYKIFLSFIAAIVIISFNSCSDYLDLAPEGQLPAEGFFETQEHAMKGVNSIYAHLRAWEMVSFAYIIMQEIPSDNAIKGSEVGDASFINE